MVSSCATSKTIYSDSSVEIATVSTTYRVVQYVGGPYEVTSSFRDDESYFHFSVWSESNLEELVHAKGYDHLYYELCDCGDAKCETEIYSYYVLTDPMKHSAAGSKFQYEVFVPKIIGGVTGISYEGPILEYTGDACLRFGAGNMAGFYLRTNKIPVKFTE
jgi:hypothetical protein